MTEADDVVDSGGLKEAPLPSKSAMVRGLVVLVMFAALLPSVLGLAGRWAWLFDLCNHFRFQCAVVLGATTVGLLLMRSWKIAAVSLAGLVLNLVFVLPLYLGSPGTADRDRPTVTLMHFNVNTGNQDRAGVIAEIQSHGPDLLFVQEVNRNWLGALEAGLKGYELVAEDVREDNFGIACFVSVQDAERLPLSITGSRAFDITGGSAQVPVIEVAFDWGGQAVKALSIHPLPPVSVAYARVRDEVLEASGRWAAEQAGPCIVLGDFNATPWSTAFRDMQSEGDLTNSQIGFGRSPTWPAGMGSLGMIPIDHLLHSDELVTVDRLIGDANGSDHKPLTVTLGWRATGN